MTEFLAHQILLDKVQTLENKTILPKNDIKYLMLEICKCESQIIQILKLSKTSEKYKYASSSTRIIIFYQTDFDGTTAHVSIPKSYFKLGNSYEVYFNNYNYYG